MDTLAKYKFWHSFLAHHSSVLSELLNHSFLSPELANYGCQDWNEELKARAFKTQVVPIPVTIVCQFRRTGTIIY